MSEITVIWDEAKKHPYISAGVAGAFVVLLYYYYTSGKETPAQAAQIAQAQEQSSANAVKALQIQTNGQVQQAQIAANALATQTSGNVSIAEAEAGAVTGQAQAQYGSQTALGADSLQAQENTNTAAESVANTSSNNTLTGYLAQISAALGLGTTQSNNATQLGEQQAAYGAQTSQYDTQQEALAEAAGYSDAETLGVTQSNNTLTGDLASVLQGMLGSTASTTTTNPDQGDIASGLSFFQQLTNNTSESTNSRIASLYSQFAANAPADGLYTTQEVEQLLNG